MDATWGGSEFTPFDFELDEPWASDESSDPAFAMRAQHDVIGGSVSPILRSNAPLDAGMDGHDHDAHAKKRARSSFTIDTQKALNQWIRLHWHSPYMDRAEQDLFMATWGLERAQLTTALNNRRQRLLGQCRVRKCDRHGRMPIIMGP
jgi:hypothetical protein